MPVIFTEYPKWIEYDGDPSLLDPRMMTDDVRDSIGIVEGKIKVLVNSEEEQYSITDNIRKKEIFIDLKETYGIDVDKNRYKGMSGMDSLEAYYQGVKAQDKPAKKKK